MYKYHTGEEVMIGDRIYYPDFGNGFVSNILFPMSKDAILWGMPNGAVIGGFGGHDVSIVFPNTEEEEDLLFLSRRRNPDAPESSS